MILLAIVAIVVILWVVSHRAQKPSGVVAHAVNPTPKTLLDGFLSWTHNERPKVLIACIAGICSIPIYIVGASEVAQAHTRYIDAKPENVAARAEAAQAKAAEDERTAQWNAEQAKAAEDDRMAKWNVVLAERVAAEEYAKTPAGIKAKKVAEAAAKAQAVKAAREAKAQAAKEALDAAKEAAAEAEIEMYAEVNRLMSTFDEVRLDPEACEHWKSPGWGGLGVRQHNQIVRQGNCGNQTNKCLRLIVLINQVCR